MPMRPLARRAATLLTTLALAGGLLGFSPADLRTAGSVTFDDIGLYEE
jgi:hypothetical protein